MREIDLGRREARLRTHPIRRIDEAERWFRCHADRAQPGQSQKVVAYAGRCHCLILFDRPEHPRFQDIVATIAMPDGRSGFLFTLDDQTLVSAKMPARSQSGRSGPETLDFDQVSFVFL